MIQATLLTKKGPIVVIGINHANWERLNAGMPLKIDLRPLTPPGTRITEVYVHYAKTYEDVVKDLQESGFDVSEDMMASAKQLDSELSKD